ncbi:MAG: dihydroorotase family protein [Candidatus Methylomirabilales bacterium]
MEEERPLDLLLVNGKVIVPESGEIEAAVGVAGGRIVALVTGDTPPARETIDLHGKIVLPGVIDPHTHVTLGPPDGWFTETRAAAVAGITTVLDFQLLSSSYRAAYPAIRDEADRRSCVDYGLHVCPCVETHLEELESYIEELGVSSFKFYMNFRGDEGAYLGVAGADDGYFYDLCQRLARYPRALLCVHTENIEIVNRLQKRLMEEGREGLHAWAASRPPVTEAENVNRAAFFGRCTGCPIYVVHLSSAAALDEIRLARRDNVTIYAETCPHYLTHTADAPLGMLAKTNPPLRTQKDVEALWEGVADGSINTIGSDHVPRPKSAKAGSTWKASRGGPVLSMIVPVLVSEGVHRRGLSLQRLAQVTSYNAARLFNLYPRKGTIQVGSDADLTVVDLDLEREVCWEALQSYADYSIYEGHRLKGWPVLTIVRGRIIARNGNFLGDAGLGHYLSR